MVSVYNDAYFLKTYKQKRKIFWFFMAITFAYLALSLVCWIYYMGLPYGSSQAKPMKWTVYLATVAYIVFAFPYLAIKWSRVRRYYRMLTYVSEGLKNEEKNYFYCFDEKSLQKDNIDVMSCVFETWNKKKQEWREREAWFDPEMPLPEFESGDYVQYIVQSNFVIQYHIITKKALEFEEVDEDYQESLESVKETEKLIEKTTEE